MRKSRSTLKMNKRKSEWDKKSRPRGAARTHLLRGKVLMKFPEWAKALPATREKLQFRFSILLHILY